MILEKREIATICSIRGWKFGISNFLNVILLGASNEVKWSEVWAKGGKMETKRKEKRGLFMMFELSAAEYLSIISNLTFVLKFLRFFSVWFSSPIHSYANIPSDNHIVLLAALHFSTNVYFFLFSTSHFNSDSIIGLMMSTTAAVWGLKDVEWMEKKNLYSTTKMEKFWNLSLPFASLLILRQSAAFFTPTLVKQLAKIYSFSF